MSQIIHNISPILKTFLSDLHLLGKRKNLFDNSIKENKSVDDL